METVEAWDRSLRAGEWSTARALLAEDATYTTLAHGEQQAPCTSADQIIELMRSWKGELPDVQVVDWEVVGENVVARLRQPAFGDDADWFQVLAVRDGLIAGLEDYPDRAPALHAAGRGT
ncbi:hypothetical protein BH20ACT24_BH20ACT24_21670 [soil metagenome]